MLKTVLKILKHSGISNKVAVLILELLKIDFVFNKLVNAADVTVRFWFHSSLDVSELAKAAKKKLQSVSRASFSGGGELSTSSFLSKL